MEAYAKRLNGIAARHGLVLSQAAQELTVLPGLGACFRARR